MAGLLRELLPFLILFCLQVCILIHQCIFSICDQVDINQRLHPVHPRVKNIPQQRTYDLSLVGTPLSVCSSFLYRLISCEFFCPRSIPRAYSFQHRHSQPHNTLKIVGHHALSKALASSMAIVFLLVACPSYVRYCNPPIITVVPIPFLNPYC